MITEQQIELLKQYKEKAFVSALLAEESHSYYIYVKNLINIPLIITNSAMVIINAIIIDQDLLKVLNIILNSTTGLVLGLINNFKIHENIQQAHQLHIKFNKLSHNIDSRLLNEIDNISNEYITAIVDDYDQIYDGMDYGFPSHIKKRIKKQFQDKLSLPSNLTIDIVEICEAKSCCNSSSTV
jgi:hypothetical protein